jgi:hypothetical protein
VRVLLAALDGRAGEPDRAHERLGPIAERGQRWPGLQVLARLLEGSPRGEAADRESLDACRGVSRDRAIVALGLGVTRGSKTLLTIARIEAGGERWVRLLAEQFLKN